LIKNNKTKVSFTVHLLRRT